MSGQRHVEASASGDMAAASAGIRSPEHVGLSSFPQPGLGKLFDGLYGSRKSEVRSTLRGKTDAGLWNGGFNVHIPD